MKLIVDEESVEQGSKGADVDNASVRFTFLGAPNAPDKSRISISTSFKMNATYLTSLNYK